MIGKEASYSTFHPHSLHKQVMTDLRCGLMKLRSWPLRKSGGTTWVSVISASGAVTACYACVCVCVCVRACVCVCVCVCVCLFFFERTLPAFSMA